MDGMMYKIMKDAITLFENGNDIDRVLKSISGLYSSRCKDNEFIARSAVAMYVSLRQAVDEAGGVGWDLEKLCKMTVMDLISHLATNGVRFTFEPILNKL